MSERYGGLFLLRVCPVYNPQPSEDLGGRDVLGDSVTAGLRVRGEERRVAGSTLARSRTRRASNLGRGSKALSDSGALG